LRCVRGYLYIEEDRKNLTKETRMASNKKIFTLRPDNSTGEKGDRILTHSADDLAEREAAAKAAKRGYTVSDVPK
jgi:hypothetical protein